MADVPLSIAWIYMTNVSNWNTPPAEFSLDGPFAAGSRGTTRMPGQPARDWVIRDVDPARGYTIESALDKGALLIFHRRFAEMPERRTKMTQRIAVHGENAAAYVEEIRAAFESNLEPGMRKIAESMAQAASQHPRSAEGA